MSGPCSRRPTTPTWPPFCPAARTPFPSGQGSKMARSPSSPRRARGRRATSAADPRVAISVIDNAQPYAMAQVRGRVTARLGGEEAWDIIDQLSVKYTGQPSPLRTDRVVFLIEPEHARARACG